MDKKFSDKLWDKTGLSFWNDYQNLFKPKIYNWVNYRLICFEMEWDKMDNSFNIELGLLGFNMRWQHSLPGTTPQSEELLERVKEFKKDMKKGGKNELSPEDS